MVDVQPTENFAIDPPLESSDMPLVGNPILARRSTPGRSKYLGWYVGVPLAVVAVCGAAYAVVAGSHSTPPAQRRVSRLPPPPRRPHRSPRPSPPRRPRRSPRRRLSRP